MSTAADGTAVDVYSFALVLFEIATREIPWNDIGDVEQTVFFDLLMTALQTGRRPAFPSAVAAEQPEYVEVMTACWAGDPAERLAFAAVVPRLATCLRRARER